jgi:hypothetical protein
MIYFNINSRQNIIDEHYVLLKLSILKKIDSSKIDKNLTAFIKDNIEMILKGTPTELDKLNKTFKSLPITLSPKSTKDGVSKIFDYGTFSGKKVNGYDAYDLAEKLNIRTCLYCNRNYTLTVKKGKKTTDKITRPTFDHFFDKGTNPLLALSIQNLIPSCTTCNSTLKGSKEFNLENNLHPYVKEDDVINHYNYAFVPHDVQSILGANTNLSVQLKISSKDQTTIDKIEKSKDVFKLEDIMSAHSAELKDLFDMRYRFSERYLELLLDKYQPLGLSLEEVYRIAFGVELNESDFSDRPFSKLKKDILKELTIIK